MPGGACHPQWPCNAGDRAPHMPGPLSGTMRTCRCLQTDFRSWYVASRWRSDTKRNCRTAGKGFVPSVTAQSPPAMGTRTPQIGLSHPQHRPRPHSLTFSPSAVRMLSALGTRSAVLVFLRAEMEVTGTTACARGTRQCHRVPGCRLCTPPEPPAPCPSPAYLDVLEQEAGVEADVAGGDVEAAVVGHLSLPGAGEAGQQLFPLGELPEGFAVAGGTLAQLFVGGEAGAWGRHGVVLGAEP